MYTENPSVIPEDLGGGVTRKILSYSKNLMTVVKPHVTHGIQVLEDTVLLYIFTPMREDFIS